MSGLWQNGVLQWTEAQVAQWEAWVASRPPAVQARCRSHPPNQLYHLKNSLQIVPIYSYEEQQDGSCDTCAILVLHEHNPHLYLAFERKVFGVSFDDLTPVNQTPR